MLFEQNVASNCNQEPGAQTCQTYTPKNTLQRINNVRQKCQKESREIEAESFLTILACKALICDYKTTVQL